MSQRVSKTSENRRNRIPTQCVAGDEGLRNRGRRRGKECVIDAVSTTFDDPERSLGTEPNTTFKVGFSSDRASISKSLPGVSRKAFEMCACRVHKRPSIGNGFGSKPGCPTAGANIRSRFHLRKHAWLTDIYLEVGKNRKRERSKCNGFRFANFPRICYLCAPV